jgi:hypothetical protein
LLLLFFAALFLPEKVRWDAPRELPALFLAVARELREELFFAALVVVFFAAFLLPAPERFEAAEPPRWEAEADFCFVPALFFTDRLPEAPALADLLVERPELRPRRLALISASSAVSALTILLKLLFSPAAVCS